MDAKSKTIAFLAITVIIVVGIGGVTLLSALGKDAAPLIGVLTSTVPVAISAGAMFYGLNKVEERQKNIEKSVNGNTKFLLERIDTSNLSADEVDRLGQIIEHNDSLVQRESGKHVAP